MTSLGYGLNITKKASGSSIPSRPPPAKRKAIFEDEEDGSDPEDSNAAVETAIEDFGGLAPSKPSTKPTSSRQPPSKSSKLSLTPKAYTSLSALHTTKLHQKEAVSIDPSIYDYDAFHTTAKAARSSAIQTDDPKKPRYMASLLAAAETRKRDALLAKDRLLLKEREAEGDEFADKEKFVTAAYKAQQEENRKLEEEESKREEREQEARRKSGAGMRGFYKDVLERGEKKHAEVVQASLQGIGDVALAKDEDEHRLPKEKSEVEIAREKGAMVNDEGQVVDKRQLLSAGLNKAPSKPVTKPSSGAPRPSSGALGTMSGPQGKAAALRAQRERQTRMMEEQLAASTKQAEEEEAKRRNELEAKAQSKKSGQEIEGAKERYLRRKREKEEETKRTKEGNAD